MPGMGAGEGSVASASEILRTTLDGRLSCLADKSSDGLFSPAQVRPERISLANRWPLSLGPSVCALRVEQKPRTHGRQDQRTCRCISDQATTDQ